MIKHFLHFLFLPCSEATLLMEKKSAGTIMQKENLQLSAHLMICKWCRAYNKKLEMLDQLLKKSLKKEEKIEFNDSDIQEFKNNLIEKLK